MADPLTTAFLPVIGVALAAGGVLFFKAELYLFGLLLGGGLGLMAADALALEMTMTLVAASWGATLVSIALGATLSASPGELNVTVSGVLTTSYWAVFVGGVLAQVGVRYWLRVHVDDGQNPRDVLLRKAGRTVGSRRG